MSRPALSTDVRYVEDDASWPALVAMLNEFLLDYRVQIADLRRQLEAKDRAIAAYRQMIGDFWDTPTDNGGGT